MHGTARMARRRQNGCATARPPAFALIEPFGSGVALAQGKLPVVRKREGGAFTLIELLVVVAIISLLVSILMPSLSKAKELAKLTACTARVHGISLQLVMYSEDHDGRIICVRHPTATSIKTWIELLEEHGLQHDMTACPVSQFGLTKRVLRFGHYGGNPHLLRRWDVPPLNAEDVPNPAGKIFIGDAGGFQISDYVIQSPHSGYWYVPGTRPEIDPNALNIVPELWDDFTNGRHIQGVNLGWGDGHASWIDSQTLGDQILDNQDHSWWVSTLSSAAEVEYAW